MSVEVKTGPRPRYFCACALLFFLIFIIYGNTFHASWHLDDDKIITENASLHINDLLLGSLVKTFYANPDQVYSQKKKLYRPLSCLTLAINWYFGKTNVVGYHLVNITIHFFTAFFLYLTVYNIIKTPNVRERYHGKAHFIALLTATLWAVNPIQTQAVTYIVQRMASMAAMFYVLSILFYIKGRFDNSYKQQAIFFCCCFISYLLGLASKENVILLPISLLLVEMTFFHDLSQAKTRSVFIWITVGVGVCIIVFGSLVFLRSNPLTLILGDYENRFFTPMQRLMTEPRILIFYLSQIFYPIPTRLSIEHDVVISTSLLDPWNTLPSIGLVLILIALGLWHIRRMPLLSFAILFFFLNHSIESTFLNLELIFEHRNYLPSLFLFLPVSIGIKRVLDYYYDKKRSMFYALVSFCILLLVGLGTGTFIRNMAWATERVLWEDAKKKAPKMMRPAHNLAWAYYERVGRYDTAIELYKQALSLNGHNVYHRNLALNNMASIYLKTKNFKKSVALCKEAVVSVPTHTPLYAYLRRQLAVAYMKMREWKSALYNIDISLSKRPNDIRYINLKGFILLNQKRPKEAIPYLRRALRLNQGYKKTIVNLGACFSLLGKYDRAELYFSSVYSRYPNEIMTLLWLIAINLRADDKEDADYYMDRLFAAASVNGLKSALITVSEDNIMSLESQVLLIRAVSKKLRGKSSEIAKQNEHLRGQHKNDK